MGTEKSLFIQPSRCISNSLRDRKSSRHFFTCNICKPACDNRVIEQFRHQFREFLSHAPEHHTRLIVHFEKNEHSVGIRDRFVISTQEGAVSVDGCHTIAECRLSRLRGCERTQGFGIMHNTFERGSLQSVGKGECPHRKRRIGELKQPRKRRHVIFSVSVHVLFRFHRNECVSWHDDGARRVRGCHVPRRRTDGVSHEVQDMG